MKIFVLFSVSLGVALGMPPVKPDVLQHPILTEDQRPLVGHWLPAQGHVVVEEPAPQLRLKEAEDTGKEENIQVEEKPQVKDEPEVQAQSDFKVELDVKEKTERLTQKPEQGSGAMPGDKVDPEPASPDFKVESEVKVEPESQDKSEFETKSETGLEVEEKHMDMEGTYEMMDQPITHLEPMNDEDDANVNSEHEMSEEELLEAERTIMTAFQSPDPDADEQLLPEEEEALAEKNNEALMILEPEVSGDQGVSMTREGSRLDAMGEPMLPLEEYIPNKEDFSGLKPEIQQNPLTVDMLMRENPDQGFVYGEEPVMDNMPVMDQTEINGDYQRFSLRQSKQATGRCYYPDCPGVVLQGKCYVFYNGPKRAEEAEFFCQRSFTGGHLASITTEHVHREVMRLIHQTNGAYRRIWIGGLRYLGTGGFIWLDGEHWGYADWLSGEPNNTADKEDCVEMLAHAFGKFNDFTCWEPQAFVCSYPYH